MKHGVTFSLALIIPALGLVACSSGFSGSIKSEVKSAQELIKQKKDAEASELLQQVLAQDPQDPKANFYAAIVAEHKKELEDAQTKLSAAIETDPAYAEAYSERALVNTKLGHNDAALADINQAIRLQPDLPLNHLRRALIGNNSKDWRMALESLDQVEKLDAKGNAYWIAAYRAEAYLGMKEFKQALDYFNQAVEIGGKEQPVVYLRRANCRAREGDYAGSKADCLTYMKARPDDPWGHALLGALKCVENDLPGARSEYGKTIGKATASDLANTIDMGADNCSSVTELIDIYLKKKDPETASAILTRVEAHRPLEPQEQYRLALANFALKRPERALALLNSAIAMAPEYVEPRVELIHYYASEGLTSKAMELQREAYSVAKCSRDKAEIAGAMLRKR